MNDWQDPKARLRGWVKKALEPFKQLEWRRERFQQVEYVVFYALMSGVRTGYEHFAEAKIAVYSHGGKLCFCNVSWGENPPRDVDLASVLTVDMTKAASLSD